VVELEPPENKRLYSFGGAALLGLMALALGSFVGVATMGAGFVLAPFIIPPGIYAGYKFGGFAADKFTGASCPNCNQVHTR